MTILLVFSSADRQGRLHDLLDRLPGLHGRVRVRPCRLPAPPQRHHREQGLRHGPDLRGQGAATVATPELSATLRLRLFIQGLNLLASEMMQLCSDLFRV